MANMYRSVLSGGGTAPTGDAVAADVLTGKTFSNAQATGISGTMPNNGAVSGQATPAQPYTIPAGYHNGSGIVTASSGTLFDQSYSANTQVSESFNITDGILVISSPGYNNSYSDVEVFENGTKTTLWSHSEYTISYSDGVCTVTYNYSVPTRITVYYS